MIDMDIMHNVFGSNQMAILKYLASFIEITSKILENVDKAIREKNQIAAIEYLHKLKGPVGTIGLKKLYKICEQAEKQINQSEWTSANYLCRDIEKILKNIEDELQKKIKISDS